jgi:ABC-type uncharacterized transport system substrate-binding protein
MFNLNKKIICKLILYIYFFLINVSIYSFDEKPIPVLISSNSTNYIKLLNQLQIYFKRNLDLHFISSLEEEEESKLYDEISKDSPKFIITLGNLATNNSIILNSEIPILYSMVTAAPILDTPKNRKICGLNTDVPIKEFFITLKEINKDYKNVISFYSNKNSEFLTNEGIYEADRYDINFFPIKVNSKEDLREYIEKSTLKIDAIYLLPDPIYDKETFTFISNYSINKKIILMTQIPYLINLGVTFSITPFYNRSGIYLSEIAEKLYDDPSFCINNKLFPNKEFSFNLNLEYSKLSNIEIPQYIINRSNNNNRIVEGINQYEKGNFEISLAIMNKILDIDSNNKIAQFYRDTINESLNGEKLKILFLEAKENHDQKKYSKEREVYKNILTIFPSSKEAKLGIEKSFYMESEEKREEAKKFELSNEISLAINKYLDSLKLYKNNEKTKNDLKILRGKEITKIPIYKELGFKHYNERNYEDAEHQFTKILLIDPSNRQADEYKKLSINKKIGMKRYLECIKNNDKKCTLIWEDIKSWK